MLAGLKEGQEKMSKSDPDSAIFMEGEPTVRYCVIHYVRRWLCIVRLVLLVPVNIVRPGGETIITWV
jgi:hypothetical protein